MPRALSLAALTVVLATRLGAQPPLAEGTRVRVLTRPDSSLPVRDTAGGSWRVGTVVSSSPQALVLKPAPLSEPFALSMAEVHRIDVSRGRPDHKWAGAMVGGLVTGAAFVGLACAFGNGSCNISNNVGGFLGYYAVGAIPGVIAGGMVGARMQGPERWSTAWARP